MSAPVGVKLLKLNPYKGLGIPAGGIVWKGLSTQTQLTHKHHHYVGAVCPSYGMVSLNTPDRMRATSLEGVGQECFCSVATTRVFDESLSRR